MNKLKVLTATFVSLVGFLVLAGCVGLPPQTTFQGRLTDASGNPINGSATITYSLYKVATGGTAIYSESETVTVNQGLFSSVVGPTSVVAGMKPEDLAEPLYLEISVQQGGFNEVLTPRQRLYGAPYAFTLMPGAVISDTFSTNVQGANGVPAITSIHNSNIGSTDNPALPALLLMGDTGLEVDANNSVGRISSRFTKNYSDLVLRSSDDIFVHISDQYPASSFFRVTANPGQIDSHSCVMNNNADWTCDGTKSAVVQTDDQKRLMYAIESPEVWFEDFGSAQLINGAVTVAIDALFAETVNLSEDYYVYLTPLGDCNGLYVYAKTPTGFEVRELGGGLSSVAFDYRIVAKRMGYETQRLEPADWGLDKAQVEVTP